MAEFKVQLLKKEKETKNEAKPFKVENRLVYEACKRVKSNKGSAGIDGVEMERFDENLSDNLYKLWNRMSSGHTFQRP